MTQAPTVALLGCGQAARTHSKAMAKAAPDLRRVYASRDVARARAYNARHGGGGAYGSYAEAIDDEAIDAVVITTPPATHLELALAASRAGKHVLVEKPAFPDTASFDQAAEAAVNAGRLLLVTENYFYRPLLARVRHVVGSGELGRVLFVHVNALKEQATSGWRDAVELVSGGALFEGGVHWVDFVSNLGLELRSVHGLAPRPSGPLERSMLLALEYADGAVGTLAYSWEVHSPMKGVRISRIFGTEGTLTFESNGVFLLQTGRRFRFALLPGLRDIAGFRPMWRDFARALRSGEPPRFTTALARRDLAFVEQAYASAGLATR